jgi:hypothetical protein
MLRKEQVLVPKKLITTSFPFGLELKTNALRGVRVLWYLQ